MARSFRAALGIGLVSMATLYGAAPAGIALVGTGSIPGSALDLSGLSGLICQAGSPGNCIPRATLGGRVPATDREVSRQAARRPSSTNGEGATP